MPVMFSTITTVPADSSSGSVLIWSRLKAQEGAEATLTRLYLSDVGQVIGGFKRPAPLLKSPACV